MTIIADSSIAHTPWKKRKQNVTGSEKTAHFVHKIFFSTSTFSLPNLTQNILTSIFFLPLYLQIFAYTHTKFERREALVKGQARYLKADTFNFSFTLKINYTVIGRAKTMGKKRPRVYSYNSTYMLTYCCPATPCHHSSC